MLQPRSNTRLLVQQEANTTVYEGRDSTRAYHIDPCTEPIMRKYRLPAVFLEL